MKTTAIFIFLTLFMSNIALAEKGEKREKPDIDAIIVQLKLSDAQAEKLKAIMEEQKQVMQAKRKQKRENKEEMTREKRQAQRNEMRTQREAQRDAMDEKLLTVLNYEQLYKFKKYMRQFHKKQGNKQGKGGERQK